MNHYHVTHSVHIATFIAFYAFGKVGEITFEKDLNLQVEMAVMEQLGNVLEDGKIIFWGP